MAVSVAKRPEGTSNSPRSPRDLLHCVRRDSYPSASIKKPLKSHPTGVFQVTCSVQGED